MTREEAIDYLLLIKLLFDNNYVHEALDVAIEALSQPIVAQCYEIDDDHIYCSPQIKENVKVVVRCKDCKQRKKNKFCLEHKRYEKDDDGYCHYGERGVYERK